MNNIAGFKVNEEKCVGCGVCVKVCPGAIEVLGKKPEDSLPVPDIPEAERVINELIANRHSCRRYQNRNVDSAMIKDMLRRLGNAPNGGNKQQVEFTLLDDSEQMHVFRNLAYKEMERLAEKGIYPLCQRNTENRGRRPDSSAGDKKGAGWTDKKTRLKR